MASKYKRRVDGRYQKSVQVGIHPNGKRKFKVIYAATVRDLEEAAAKIKDELSKGIYTECGKLTVGWWASEWLLLYKSNKEYKTVRMYADTVKNHIIPELGNYKLKDLKTVHIQKLINKRFDEGLTRTVQLIKLTLNQMLQQAVKNDFIYKNVCDAVEMPTIQKNKKRSLTDNEKALILECELELKTKAFVYMLLYTGLRKGEALALNRSDIDLVNNTITVSKDIVIESNQATIKSTPKSNAGYRTIPITSSLREVLIEYLPSIELIVFPSEKGEIMSHSAFRRFWEKFLRQLNRSAGGTDELNVIAKDITPHIFRHTYATSLANAGIPPKTMQRLLGHATVQMSLDIYTHAMENNREVEDILNSYFGKIKCKLAP